MESKGPEPEEKRMEPQCKTCRNIFDFPECCTENLSDCFKVVQSCGNYDEFKARQNTQPQSLVEAIMLNCPVPTQGKIRVTTTKEKPYVIHIEAPEEVDRAAVEAFMPAYMKTEWRKPEEGAEIAMEITA